jgi:bacterioferritin-associated ferredoxin
MYLCLCQGITETDVKAAGQAGLVTPCQLIEEFDLRKRDCCGRCAKNVHEFVSIARCAVDAPCSATGRSA